MCKEFTCYDCKEFYHTLEGSFKLVNKIIKGDDKIICKDCIKNYNIRKPD